MKQKILLLLALLSITLLSKAQDTEFWCAIPQSSDMGSATVPPYNRPILLAISNPNSAAANVQITLYNGGNPIVINETIPAEGFYKKDFITEAEATQVQNPKSQAGNVAKYGIHISSDIKVTAYYMINNTDSRDVYTLKGNDALGTEFYVPMQHDQHATGQAYFRGYDQIDIVATEDGTTVTVIPRTTIRVGASGSAPANTAYTKTLNKGETLKIMEHTQTNGSLAGTHITASKPIAVSTTEDLVKGDISGDQIVPIPNLGKQYIVAKGYMLSSVDDRVYFVGTKNNTTLTIYNGGSNVTTTINAGGFYVYHFGQSPSSQSAVYVEASEPVYVYQRTGYNEQGAALLPSMHAISQNKVTYFQVSAHYEKGILVYREGSENGFTISYGNTTTALPLTPISIPNVTGWKCARFDLPAAANDQVVTISNPDSYFSFGYIAANYPTNNSTCFGYLTAFGSFRFPYDIIYKCSGDVTVLEGGYANSYKWEYATAENGPYTTLSETGYSLSASNEGYYKLTMNQDPKIVSDIVYVRNLDFQASITSSTTSGVTTFSPSVNPALASDPNLQLSYSWEFEGGTPATSTDENPVVTWTGTELTAKLTVTGEANSASSTGSCVGETVAYRLQNIEVCMKKADITIGEGFVLPAGTYQWQSSKDKVMWTNISGATSSTFTIPAQSQKRGITFYRVVVTGNPNTEPVKSDAIRVRFKSCQLPVNHNISVMGWDD